MRVTVITTLDHNVGDDFVRLGILHLLDQVLGTYTTEFIHKHLPITTRKELSWIHGSGLSHTLDRLRPGLALALTRRLDRVLPVIAGTDRVRDCDLLIQSGAPIYWLHGESSCATNEWWDPLIERRWVPHAGGRPFLNLAGGTCQPYHSDASEFAKNPQVLEYVRRFADLTRLTTVRDELSQTVLKHAGRTAPLLPCTSLWAVNRLGIEPGPDEKVVLNYMPGGGHFGFGQPIDAAQWERRFVSFAQRIARMHPVLLVCHNAAEWDAAGRLLPDLERFRSARAEDYLRVFARAKFGIVNRVHAAFGLASVGKPSAIVGSDTRALMGGLLGLESVFVNDATDAWLDRQAAELSAAAAFAGRMERLKAEARARYVELLRGVLGPRARTP